jgi:hypothetical protein
MRKAVFCMCIFIIFLPCFSALAAEQPFSIDTVHAYSGMDRPWGQGYTPATAGNTMTIVLPLLSDAARGDITATLAPKNPNSAPFKLQGLEKRFSPKEHTFKQDKVSAYLVTFKLELYPSRLNGEYPLVITVSGLDTQGNAIAQAFDLEAVVTDGREDKEMPQAEITSFEAGSDYLNAGEDGEIRLKVRNTSELRSIKNMTVKLQDTSGDVLPLGVDTVRIGQLPAGESAACVIPVTVAQKAAAQLHTVEITVQYTYGGGKAVSSSVKYTVDVRQPVRLAYTEAELPVRVTQGDVPAFSMTLMNMGKSIISNALLTFNVPGLTNGGSVLAGNIAPGESKAASTNFRVDGGTLGEVKGTLTISYDDAYGEAHEIELPLKTVIEEKVVPVYGALENKKGEKPYPLWIPYTACAALVLFLILQRIGLQRKIRILEERHL